MTASCHCGKKLSTNTIVFCIMKVIYKACIFRVSNIFLYSCMKMSAVGRPPPRFGSDGSYSDYSSDTSTFNRHEESETTHTSPDTSYGLSVTSSSEEHRPLPEEMSPCIDYTSDKSVSGKCYSK